MADYCEAWKEVITSRLEPVDIDRLFDEWLDETYGDVVVAGVATFKTSRALKELSPNDWDCLQADWFDEQSFEEIDGAHYRESEVSEIVEELEAEAEKEREE